MFGKLRFISTWKKWRFKLFHSHELSINNIIISVTARNWKSRGTTEKRVLQCIKNYEEGQYSYFQLLNIKNVSALHFQLFASMHLHDSLFIYILLHIICTEMHIKIWRSIKRHVLKSILVLWMFQIQF